MSSLAPTTASTRPLAASLQALDARFCRTSRSIPELVAQPSFPNGDGHPRRCRCWIVRRAAASPESSARATHQKRGLRGRHGGIVPEGSDRVAATTALRRSLARILRAPASGVGEERGPRRSRGLSCLDCTASTFLGKSDPDADKRVGFAALPLRCDARRARLSRGQDRMGRVRYAALLGTGAAESGRQMPVPCPSQRISTNVLTMPASNCDPEQRRSSSMAASKAMDFR
jgi:hypothetical protein